MCVIALTTKGNLVNKETLQNMTNNNSHGFGISWIENGKIKTFKTMDSKEFISKAIDIQSEFYNDSEILIHCRIATSGKTDLQNCHPFKVDSKTVFAHNGVLDDDIAPGTKNKSDTRVFNDRFLKQLKPEFLRTKHMRKIIGELVGDHNKLAFLTVNPNLPRNSYVINMDRGTVDDGVWYSNNSYKQKTYSSSWHSAWHITDADMIDEYYNSCEVNTDNIPISPPEDAMLIEKLSDLAEFIHDSNCEIIMDRDPELIDHINDIWEYENYGNARYPITDIMALSDRDYIQFYMNTYGEMPIIYVKDKNQFKLKTDKDK